MKRVKEFAIKRLINEKSRIQKDFFTAHKTDLSFCMLAGRIKIPPYYLNKDAL